MGGIEMSKVISKSASKSSSKSSKTSTPKSTSKSAPKSVHVVPSGSDWKVVRPNASRASGVYGKKTEAAARATGLAKKDGSSVVTHRKDGRITDVKSYGKKK